MDTLLFNNPEVKKAALSALKECVDVQQFGAKMLELLLNNIFSIKADIACGAEYGQRSEARVNSRNGYRERSLITPAGEIHVKIPKTRTGSFFPEDVIDRYCRVDRALIAAIAEMYLCGISTRKVELVVKQFGISSMSKSQVSRMCETLDSEVAAFKNRRYDAEKFAYLYLDATYVKCRVEKRSVSVALVTAVGIDSTGHKRFLDVDVVDTESYVSWKEFLGGLRERGVSNVKLVVSDEHAGLVRAIGEVFYGAAHQRCITHLMRNVASHIHKKSDQTEARELLKACFKQKSPNTVRACYQLATERISTLSSRAGSVLVEAEDEALAYLAFPTSHWVKIRTNNVQERANREIKRRTRVVQSFPSTKSLIRLVGACLAEADEEWSCRCVISAPSLARAFDENLRAEPTADQIAAAKEKAAAIIQEVIDACSSDS